MRLSIIIPAFNEAEHIADVVASARRSAERGAVDHEIIVVNDASTDATAGRARSAGATVIDVNKRQIAAVRNAGAAAATGEVLVFVDGDTRLTDGSLAAVVRAVGNGAVAGGARVGFDDDASPASRLAVELWNFIGRVAGWAAGSFLFARRDAFEAVGGFDERFFAAEEIVISERLKRRGRFVIVSPPVVTSSRKERTHGPLIHLVILGRVILSAGRSLQRRDALPVWYDGKREPS